MRYPTLNELPSPPPGKMGWPWTEEIPGVPDAMFNGQPWPKISIVTPSFNQGEFIEETIRSVLLQGYPNLEYIIIDGGSSDGSVTIIHKYSRHIDYWVSERDNGQSEALQRGFARASGDIFGWINSDDVLASGALQAVANAWICDRPALVAGTVENFEDGQFGNKHTIFRQKNISFKNLLRPWIPTVTCHQPGILFSADLYTKVGGIEPQWHIKMDYDLFLRMLAQDDRIASLSQTIAYFRLHGSTKTAIFTPMEMREHRRVTTAYLDHLSQADRLRLRTYYAYTSFVLSIKRLFTGKCEDAKGHMKMLSQVLSPIVTILMIGWIARYVWQKAR